MHVDTAVNSKEDDHRTEFLIDGSAASPRSCFLMGISADLYSVMEAWLRQFNQVSH